MNYKFRLISLITIDSAIVLFSMYLSHFFLNPYNHNINLLIISSSFVLLFSHHALSYYYHLYKRIWRYASIDEIIGLCKVIIISIVITAFSQLLLFHDLYERALFLTLVLHIVLLCGVRLVWRHLQLKKGRKSKSSYVQNSQKRTLILGAGNTGRNIAQQLLQKNSKLHPVIFLDDNIHLKNLEVCGLPIVGNLTEIESVIEHYRIQHIIIAIPSLKGEKLQEIISRCKRHCENVQILPTYTDFATGELQFSKIRDVSIEDLLGREQIDLDSESISSRIKDKTVLVTGAGGSIGSELCRQIASFSPKTLVLLDHSEYNIFNISKELKTIFKDINIKLEILSVENRERIFRVMIKHKPEMVFHSAAYKHVPLMEENIYSAISTNIFGTKNVADAAEKAEVENFVLISTDKAVNPTNIMGYTKRIAELVINGKSLRDGTKYSIVRFGNVLGSSGSVVPIFKDQIQNGGPITVTHPEMTRYFMTIPEAAQLVIQAACLSQGGETFVLDMGKPIKILDLAKQLIILSGFSVSEIPIVYTGMRPGEKIHEELFYEREEKYEKIHSKIFAFKNNLCLTDINRQLDDFLSLNEVELRDVLNKLVKGDSTFTLGRLVNT